MAELIFYFVSRPITPKRRASLESLVGTSSQSDFRAQKAGTDGTKARSASTDKPERGLDVPTVGRASSAPPVAYASGGNGDMDGSNRSNRSHKHHYQDMEDLGFGPSPSKAKAKPVQSTESAPLPYRRHDTQSGDIPTVRGHTSKGTAILAQTMSSIHVCVQRGELSPDQGAKLGLDLLALIVTRLKIQVMNQARVAHRGSYRNECTWLSWYHCHHSTLPTYSSKTNPLILTPRPTFM